LEKNNSYKHKTLKSMRCAEKRKHMSEEECVRT
jgi:hypothetical protein